MTLLYLRCKLQINLQWAQYSIISFGLIPSRNARYILRSFRFCRNDDMNASDGDLKLNFWVFGLVINLVGYISRTLLSSISSIMYHFRHSIIFSQSEILLVIMDKMSPLSLREICMLFDKNNKSFSQADYQALSVLYIAPYRWD